MDGDELSVFSRAKWSPPLALFRYLQILFMSILSPNAEEIEALASREELKEFNFLNLPIEQRSRRWN